MHCSLIILVHFHAIVFTKVNPTSRNIANGIKPGSNSKMTDKHATCTECSNTVRLGIK